MKGVRCVMFGWLVLSAASAFASNARIFATDTANGKRVAFVQDASGTPRINDKSGRYPTIKDFRDGSDYVRYCYDGGKQAVRSLLTALVEAANGDGDSYAELRSIRLNRRAEFVVVTNITDESGEHEEVFRFKPCR